MRKIFAIAVVALLVPAAYAAGEVYRWKDASGIWHFSDQPHPGAELVRGTRSGAAPPAATPAPAAPVAATTPDDALPVSKEIAQEVRDEAAAAKAQQCEKYKALYDSYVQARLIHKTDDKGNRVYMSAAEIDAARLQARSARDLACGP